MKEATKDDHVVVVDIDLNKQKLRPCLGNFENRIPGEMPPPAAIRTRVE